MAWYSVAEYTMLILSSKLFHVVLVPAVCRSRACDGYGWVWVWDELKKHVRTVHTARIVRKLGISHEGGMQGGGTLH